MNRYELSFALCLVVLAAYLTIRSMMDAPLLEDDQVTPEKPFPGPTPDRYNQEAANRIADEFLVLDLLYEVCDDWEANHG